MLGCGNDYRVGRMKKSLTSSSLRTSFEGTLEQVKPLVGSHLGTLKETFSEPEPEPSNAKVLIELEETLKPLGSLC